MPSPYANINSDPIENIGRVSKLTSSVQDFLIDLMGCLVPGVMFMLLLIVTLSNPIEVLLALTDPATFQNQSEITYKPETQNEDQSSPPSVQQVLSLPLDKVLFHDGKSNTTVTNASKVEIASDGQTELRISKKSPQFGLMHKVERVLEVSSGSSATMWFFIAMVVLCAAYMIGTIFYRQDPKTPDEYSVLRQVKKYLYNEMDGWNPKDEKDKEKAENIEEAKNNCCILHPKFNERCWFLNRIRRKKTVDCQEIRNGIKEEEKKRDNKLCADQAKDQRPVSYRILLSPLLFFSSKTSALVKRIFGSKERKVETPAPGCEHRSRTFFMKRFFVSVQKFCCEEFFINSTKKCDKECGQCLVQFKDVDAQKTGRKKKRRRILAYMEYLKNEFAISPSEQEFPYTYFRQYLETRELGHLTKLAYWSTEDESSKGRRSKTHLNTLKLRTQHVAPDLYWTNIRNEAHVRFACSMWYVMQWMRRISGWGLVCFVIIWFILTLSWLTHWDNYPVPASAICSSFFGLLVLFLLFVAAMGQMEKFIHYQRLREVMQALETAYIAFCRNPTLLQHPFEEFVNSKYILEKEKASLFRQGVLDAMLKALDKENVLGKDKELKLRIEEAVRYIASVNLVSIEQFNGIRAKAATRKSLDEFLLYFDEFKKENRDNGSK